MLTVTSHVCLTINDDNIQYTHVLPSSQGAATATTIATTCFDLSFDTAEKWGSYLSEVTVRSSIDPNEQCQDGASKTDCSQAVMGGTEGEENQGGPTLPYSSNNRSDNSDRIWCLWCCRSLKWMNGWMEMNEWMDGDIEGVERESMIEQWGKVSVHS